MRKQIVVNFKILNKQLKLVFSMILILLDSSKKISQKKNK